MFQTLFIIPHWLFTGPLTVAWLVFGLGIIGYMLSKKPKPGQAKGQNQNEAFAFVPVYIVVAAVIHFVLPMFEVEDLDRNPIGLAVRGYGFFLLLAIAAGLSAAWVRCRQLKYDFEIILSLGFWMIVCGITGARLFYLIQKREIFGSVAPADIPFLLLDVTKGGLVVYGAVIGGLIALLIIVAVRRLPLFKIADIIAPGMVIGLAIGRIGCLMNGCCFGGACNIDVVAIHFPAGSPPYMRQIATGEMLGMTTKVIEEETVDQIEKREVLTISEDSEVYEAGIRVGDHINIWTGDADVIREIKSNPDSERLEEVTIAHGRNNIKIDVRNLPNRGIGIHPTQIYSSINASILFLFLWFYFPYRKGHGEVFAWMLILYAITRFLLEAIRVDEMGAFGTPFSISQLVSFGTLALGLAILLVARVKFPVVEGEDVDSNDMKHRKPAGI